MLKLKPIRIGKKEVLPLVEGGKGVAVSTGISAGAWAACGGIGTFSGANPDFYDKNGNYTPYEYKGKTRRERHFELIEQSIKGCIAQAKIAKDFGSNNFVNMNVLWEMGGCKDVLQGTLAKVGNLIDGITCGAGMPYELAEICARFGIYYFPIVSSARAFNVLWKRSYAKHSEFLGGVVYEDPWIAGGHNGLSMAEDPNIRQEPYARVVEIRKSLNSFNMKETPIIIAGGVWWLSEWENYLDNPEVGPVMFQFGTRPLLTQESPISDEWKKKLFTIQEGDVLLNQFSPTGFYSSAVYNKFLQELEARSERQIKYSEKADSEFNEILHYGPRKRELFIKAEDASKAKKWIEEGFGQILKTPDDTIIFETEEASEKIHKDQTDCVGCLSRCRFSNWDQHGDSDQRADPRSFCIQKTLKDIAHGGSIQDNLMFSGANVFRFGQDSFYKNGFIPTVKELIDRIKTGF